MKEDKELKMESPSGKAIDQAIKQARRNGFEAARERKYKTPPEISIGTVNTTSGLFLMYETFEDYEKAAGATTEQLPEINLLVAEVDGLTKKNKLLEDELLESTQNNNKQKKEIDQLKLKLKRE